MENTIKHKILLVEDEPTLAEIVKESLEMKGYTVHHESTCAGTIKFLNSAWVDLIVLDVMLPDGDGFKLLKQIRKSSQTPTLFLTSKSLPNDVVTGFESGGNDYLKKPFSLEELTIRIKFLLKQVTIEQAQVRKENYEIGDYTFHYPIGILEYHGQSRKLTSRETDILFKLLTSRDILLKRSDLLMEYWGNDDYFSGRSLDVFITKLRKYLMNDPSVKIVNFRGQGYKLIY